MTVLAFVREEGQPAARAWISAVESPTVADFHTLSAGMLRGGKVSHRTCSSAEKIDFFISYTGADQAWAEWVAWELETAGRTVRLRAWDAVPGENIVTWISLQQEAAERTIALCSPSYFASSYCMIEMAVALRRQALIPLRIAYCEPLGPLRAINCGTLFDLDESAARHRLLQAIGLVEGGRTPTGGFPGAPTAGNDDAGRPSFPRSLPRTWNVAARNVWFVGRETVLSALRESFSSAASNRVASHVLTGIGGGGKTQLAVEYAYRFAADYSLVWWVPAEQPATVAEAFGALADTLDLAEDGDLQRRARRALDRLRERSNWLLVFDNVEERSVLAEWWPSGSGHVLITGRSRALREFGETTEVYCFTPGESLSLLHRRVTHMTGDEAIRVAGALGHLPLAVGQAAAYLSTTRMTPHTYLVLLDRAVSHAFAERPTDYPTGLLGSVAMTMDRLEQRNPVAVEMLRCAAFLAPEPLPQSILSAMVRPSTEAIVAIAAMLYSIESFGVARIENNTLHLHRLTQAIIRDGLTAAERTRIIGRTQSLLAEVAPPDPDRPDAWPSYTELAVHVKALFEHVDDGGRRKFRTTVLNVIDCLTRSGQYAAAMDLSKRVFDIWSGLDGSDHPDALHAAYRYADALRRTGKFDEAEILDRDTYERRRRLLGQGHRDTLLSADALALDVRGVGNRPAARDWHAQALDMARKTLGYRDPQTLELAGNLALDLYGLGETEAARVLDEETLELRRAVLGEDHPRTLASARNLAHDLRDLGGYAEARALDQSTFDISRRVLGPDHPDTLLAASSLAVDHYAMHEYEAAQALHQDTLHRSRRILGEDHPDTLQVVNSLAVDLYRIGDVAAAYELHCDTLDRLRRTLGRDNPLTLHVAHNLARDIHGLGRYGEACDLWKDTLERRCRVLGADHPETRRTGRRLRDCDCS